MYIFLGGRKEDFSVYIFWGGKERFHSAEESFSWFPYSPGKKKKDSEVTRFPAISAHEKGDKSV